MDTLIQDLRFADRTLTRRPTFAVAAILSLGLGIGASAAIFSVANGLLLRPVPGVTRGERLVEISSGDFADLSFPMVQLLGAERSVLESLAALVLAPVSVVTDRDPIVRGGLAVTGGYFEVLGVRPAMGRLFGPGEASFPRVAPVALVSHDFWRVHLAASGDAIGRTVKVNGTPVSIIGVLSPGFGGHHTGLQVDLFLPLGLRVPGLPSPETLGSTSSMLETIGRLAPGTSRAAAATVLSATGERALRELDPDSAGRFDATVSAWGPLPATVRGGATAFFAGLAVLVGLALAMACVNVTTVLLARATERQRELAIRRAMGATGGRLARQLVTEAVLLFAVSGTLGTVAAAWGVSLLGRFSPPLPIPGRLAFTFPMDWRVLTFALALTTGAGIIFSLLPSIQSGRFALVSALKQSGDGVTVGHTRLRRLLVALQVGTTTLLLVAAVLFARALHRLETLDPGWSPARVTVASFDLTLNGTDRQHGAQFYRALLARAAVLPGVESAALAVKLPLGGRSSFGDVTVPGVEPPPGRRGFEAFLNRVSPGYLATLGIPLLQGRDIAAADVSGAPLVAIVNRTMAARLWPRADAVGQRFEMGSGPQSRSFEVVGVVADAKYSRLDEAATSFYYVAAAQFYNPEQILHVRTAPGIEVAGAIQSISRELDPNLPVPTPRPMSEALALFFLPQRIAAFVAGAMGVFGLMLAAVGVYGVTAFMASARRREVGIRLAFGGTTWDILGLMTRQGGLAPLAGLAFGLGAAAVFASFVRQVVSGIDPLDPVAFGSAVLVILTVTLAAILIPMWRVLRADPLRALREE